MERLRRIAALKELGSKKAEAMKESTGEWAKDIRSRYQNPEFERAEKIELVKGTESSSSDPASREEKGNFLFRNAGVLRVDNAKK